MKLILCVDDQNGLSFNNRRQSRDSALTRWLLEQTGGLTYLPFSAVLFQGEENAVLSSLADLPSDAWLFLEEAGKIPPENEVTELLLCHWNRHYPADIRLALDLSSFQITETHEFPGNSHERITVEHYKRI